MKTTILPTRDDNGRFCFEWIVTDADGSFLFGGYARTRAIAESDMAISMWRDTEGGK